MSDTKKLHDFELKTLGGKPLPLKEYNKHVMLIVNTASKCGFTKQYEGLEKLYKAHKDNGLVIIGVPSNDFGAQEPGSNEEIAEFCKLNYGVSFPMTEKTVVKGSGKSEFFKHLTDSAPEKGEIKWNFEKFLVAKDGSIVGRYGSDVAPEDPRLQEVIKTQLKK